MKSLLFTVALTTVLHSFLFSQGKVGINTTTPAAMLHVMDSSVVFTGFNPIPITPANPPVSGAGTRMMWYPDKAAFRAGNVTGNHWNKDSIGTYSIAVGYNSKAKGSSCIALGGSTTASGLSTTALGFNTNASGLFSTALGGFTIARGEGSIAMGKSTTANGDFSTAMGISTKANYTGATAMGYVTIASGYASTAMGNVTTASGGYSTTMGSETMASGFYSIAMGEGTIASGDHSTSMGFGTNAIGDISNTFGNNTKARPYASFAIGQYNDTTTVSSSLWHSNDPVFIIGNGLANNARTNAMTVLKNGNVGIGPDVTPTHLLHVNTNDPGDGGWTDGIMVENTNATTGEAAISFRNTSVPSNKQWIVGLDQTPPLFSFDYGTSFTSVNSKMVLDTLGKVGIGTTSPDAHLHISKGTGGGHYHSNAAFIIEDNATSYIQLSNPDNISNGILSGNTHTDIRSGIIFFGDSSISFRAGGNLTKLTIENNGTVGIGTTSPDYLLEVNGSAGKPGGGSWSNSSDIRLKKDIHPYTDGLPSLLKINPVTYHYNDVSGFDTGPEYVGVIAQQLQEVAPYMVSVSNKKTEDDVNDYLQVDNSAMMYMLINAVKEQQAMIESLQKRIETLEKGN